MGFNSNSMVILRGTVLNRPTVKPVGDLAQVSMISMSLKMPSGADTVSVEAWGETAKIAASLNHGDFIWVYGKLMSGDAGRIRLIAEKIDPVREGEEDIEIS